MALLKTSVGSSNNLVRNSYTVGILLLAVIFAVFSSISLANSAQSTITEAEGYACMGYDKSRKQTEQEALTNAKRKAGEYASTYIKSETRVKDFQLEKDIIDAYANATVKIIEELERTWYKDPSSGDCFKVKIKAEVIPDERAIKVISKGKGLVGDPSALLNVRVWADKKEYKKGERIKIYIKGNKPFHARVLYKDASGELLQLLPNPYRSDNYFNGGVVYEIPSADDRFELEVSPPFGRESIIVYASSSPLGDISLQETGGIYQVKTKTRNIGTQTRGVKITGKTGNKKAAASEFFEDTLTVKTGR